MGRVRNSEGSRAGHRAGPLKQANKKHKTGRHRSKGMLDTETRGRVPTEGSITKRQKGMSKRAERKKQAAIERMKKMSETVEKKKCIGGLRGAPITVALLPLSPTTNVDFMLKFILSNVKGFGTILGQSSGGAATHIKLSNGKNIMLIKPPSNDIWAVLDTLKQADVALWLLPILDELTPEGWTLLKTAKEQGLPTPFVGVGSTFSKSEEKSWLKSVHKLLPAQRIFGINNPGQISHLLRLLSVTKIVIPKGWGLRSSLFIESCAPIHAMDQALLHPNYVAADPEGGHRNLLQVTGVVRRKNLNPYKPVLISGVGAFKIVRIDVTPNQIPDEFISEEQREQVSETNLPPRFLFDPLAIPQDEVDPVGNDDEMEDDDMGSDIDALDDADFEDQDSEESDDCESQLSMDVESQDSSQSKKKKVESSKKTLKSEGSSKSKTQGLPKGTSDYQADWLVHSDGEEGDGQIIASDEELEGSSSGEESEEEEDAEMDWEEEKRALQLSKDAKTEAEFPDWIDTPVETLAKVRFQKYRGLNSFKNSTWDVNENLPKEYGGICQFQNYRHVLNVVLGKKASVDGPGWVPIGQRVTLLLRPVDEATVKAVGVIGASVPVSLVSLLRHEMKMSVLNLQLNLSQVLKNKEELSFQMGYHRFTAKPVLSEISPGNKHRMIRFGQVNQSCMATVFAPILFPPSSVLAFKTIKAELIPVAAGHLFSIDPARLMIKRVLLSGHPFKVSNKNAVIRFMFFHREDIEWFKPVELRTRYGRRGHIKEPLGTHGHMKCSFDGVMKSQDTVLMPLYKRVFPKMNYETFVPSFTVFDSYQK